MRLITYTAPANVAMGRTVVMSLGNPSTVNSRKTRAVCPSPIKRSNSTTARLIQKIATRTNAKKLNRVRNWDNI